MAKDKIEPLLARLAQLACESPSEYKVFQREDERWVIHYKDLTMLQAKSKNALYNVLISYVRGYERALQDAQYLRKV
jgi:hypothetical protein